MRVNQEQDGQPDGVMIAFFLRPEDAGALALADVPDGVEALPASEMHVTLAYLGKVDEVFIDQASLLAFVADYARYRVALPVSVGGYGRFLATAEGDLEPVLAMVEGEQLCCLRDELVEYIGYMTPVGREHGFIPHVTLAYAPAGVEVPLAGLQRREMVFDALAVSWGGTTITFPLQGQVREVQVNEKDNAKVEPKVKANEGEATEQESGGQGEATQQPVADATLSQLAQAVQELGGVETLVGLLNGLKSNSDGQKATLISQIKANRNNAFSDAQLQAMGPELLQSLARTLTPGHYGGQGGAAAIFNGATQEDEWTEYQAPKA